MKRNQFLESIAQTIQDYRKGEINQITPTQIDKWVKQFDVHDQITILSEIDRILKRFYYSKERVKSSVRDFLANISLFDTDPRTSLASTNFLHIKQRGESLNELLKVVDEILHEDYNLSLNQCSGSNVYVYIDDCIYSGNQLSYDVIPWIKQNAPSGSKLVIYHIARHKYGYYYASRKIKKEADKKDIEVKYHCTVEIDNWRNKNSLVEFIWPRELSPPSDPNVNKYYELLKKKHNELIEKKRVENFPLLFRDYEIPPKQEKVFSSSHSRDIVEKAFLKVGAHLVMAMENNNTEGADSRMRPLGYEKMHNFGFGSLFVTYRNIANNCPLAVCYGNPDSSQSHPLGLWYPLFPRKNCEGDKNWIKLF